MENFKPLPDSLTIKKSKLHGLGLFAEKNINKNTYLGLSHIQYIDDLIRTPLGGFYNHSDNPNCKKIKTGNYYHLYTIKDIKKGEEITVKYTFYDV